MRAGDHNAVATALLEARQLIVPLWQANPNERLRQLYAESHLLSGELLAASGQVPEAETGWREAEQLLVATEHGTVPFDRLDLLVRVLHRLGRAEEAAPHMERMRSAGYVEDEPWPSTNMTLAMP